MTDENQLPGRVVARTRRCGAHRIPGSGATALIFSLLLPLPGTAQAGLDTRTSGFADLEVRRSRRCVTTLARVDSLDARLEPLSLRARRLVRIAEAIAIEDRGVVPSLDVSNDVERAVRDWFTTDSVLAQRIVDTGAEGLQETRSEGRTMVQERVVAAVNDTRAQADSALAENQELLMAAGPCDGAIFVRPVVVEACGDQNTRLCRAAANPAATDAPFRFVETAEGVWDIQELRPWTPPEPLTAAPQGVDGARTIGYARIGNVVVTAAFAPILKEKTRTTAAERLLFDQTNQVLGLTFDHPDLAFTPGLALRAALPEPLAGEDSYMVHFGAPGEPDVVWTSPAGAGVPLEASLPLEPAHVLKFRAGEPLALTALRDDKPVFTIELSDVNQAQSAQALLGYMESGLARDVRALVPPRG